MNAASTAITPPLAPISGAPAAIVGWLKRSTTTQPNPAKMIDAQ